MWLMMLTQARGAQPAERVEAETGYIQAEAAPQAVVEEVTGMNSDRYLETLAERRVAPGGRNSPADADRMNAACLRIPNNKYHHR